MDMKVKRPWGNYTVITQQPGFKVKLVSVSPGKRLSLQKHKFRSEHWVVVAGKAKITKDHHVYFLKKNESSFISKDCIHRIENPTKKPLKIIEVQCGNTLHENDIIRLRDDYQRI
jgi:mannose-6-phosphate isomerase-like protein (cupin superfamily)